MRILNEKLLNAVDASVSQNSAHGLLASAFGYSLQAVITGTATGTLKLQGSNDPVPDASFLVPTFTVSNWTDILDSTQSVTGAGTLLYNVEGVFYNWVRAVYTASSGTGTITIIFNSKGF